MTPQEQNGTDQRCHNDHAAFATCEGTRCKGIRAGRTGGRSDDDRCGQPGSDVCQLARSRDQRDPCLYLR